MGKKKKLHTLDKGPKEKGPRFLVVDEKGKPFYRGEGVPEREAHRLANGLVAKGYVQEV